MPQACRMLVATRTCVRTRSGAIGAWRSLQQPSAPFGTRSFYPVRMPSSTHEPPSKAAVKEVKEEERGEPQLVIKYTDDGPLVETRSICGRSSCKLPVRQNIDEVFENGVGIEIEWMDGNQPRWMRLEVEDAEPGVDSRFEDVEPRRSRSGCRRRCRSWEAAVAEEEELAETPAKEEEVGAKDNRLMAKEELSSKEHGATETAPIIEDVYATGLGTDEPDKLSEMWQRGLAEGKRRGHLEGFKMGAMVEAQALYQRALEEGKRMQMEEQERVVKAEAFKEGVKKERERQAAAEVTVRDQAYKRGFLDAESVAESRAKMMRDNAYKKGLAEGERAASAEAYERGLAEGKRAQAEMFRGEKQQLEAEAEVRRAAAEKREEELWERARETGLKDAQRMAEAEIEQQREAAYKKGCEDGEKKAFDEASQEARAKSELEFGRGIEEGRRLQAEEFESQMKQQSDAEEESRRVAAFNGGVEAGRQRQAADEAALRDQAFERGVEEGLRRAKEAEAKAAEAEAARAAEASNQEKQQMKEADSEGEDTFTKMGCRRERRSQKEAARLSSKSCWGGEKPTWESSFRWSLSDYMRGSPFPGR